MSTGGANDGVRRSLHSAADREASKSNAATDAGTRKGEENPSSVNSDTLIVFRKKFFFPNDLVVRAPEKFDRIRHPPPGYISCSERILRAGFRFPMAPEFLEILKKCDVALSQFSFRALMVIMGLIVFFREKGKTLTRSYLGGLCSLTSDSAGHVGFRGKKDGVHFLVPAPAAGWTSGFFYVKNEWNLRESWGELKGFKSSADASVGEILKVLNISKMETLKEKLHYISTYITEDRLFKVGLSIQTGRSHAVPMKCFNPIIPDSLPAPVPPSESLNVVKPTFERLSDDEIPLLKRKKLIDLTKKTTDATACSKDPVGTSESTKLFFPNPPTERILNHLCRGRLVAGKQVDQALQTVGLLNAAMDEWNIEFVKTKHYLSEYEKRLNSELKTRSSLEGELAGCRAELATLSTVLSVQRRESDRSCDDLVEARADIRNKERVIRDMAAEKKSFDREREQLRKNIAEKESALAKGHSAAAILKAVEDFKASHSYQKIIDDHVQKVRDHIFDVEMKELERQSLEEGFTRGFLKAVRLVHRKTGADTSGISLSQVSEDDLGASGDGDIESVLKDVLPSDDEDLDIEK